MKIFDGKIMAMQNWKLYRISLWIGENSSGIFFFRNNWKQVFYIVDLLTSWYSTVGSYFSLIVSRCSQSEWMNHIPMPGNFPIYGWIDITLNSNESFEMLVLFCQDCKWYSQSSDCVRWNIGELSTQVLFNLTISVDISTSKPHNISRIGPFNTSFYSLLKVLSKYAIRIL